MKILQSSIFRAVCAIAVGIMILYKTEATIQYITIAVGVLFFISGLISCLGYYNSLRTYKEKKVVDDKGKVHISSRPFIPIIGVGSIILGIILFLMPGTFVKWLLYILAIILILGAINLMMTLISVRKFCIMPAGYWVMPVLVLLAGVFIQERGGRKTASDSDGYCDDSLWHHRNRQLACNQQSSQRSIQQQQSSY